MPAKFCGPLALKLVQTARAARARRGGADHSRSATYTLHLMSEWKRDQYPYGSSSLPFRPENAAGAEGILTEKEIADEEIADDRAANLSIHGNVEQNAANSPHFSEPTPRRLRK